MVEISPPKCKEFRHRQPPGDNPAICPLPCNQLMISPPGGGKTCLLRNLLLNPKLYRSCFERIYVFSNTGPNGDERALDRTWDEVQDYSQKVLKVDQRREKTFFNTMDEAALGSILKQWLALGDAIKERIEAGHHKNEVKGACIILDDYIDSHRFARTSPIVEEVAPLFFERHFFRTIV